MKMTHVAHGDTCSPSDLAPLVHYDDCSTTSQKLSSSPAWDQRVTLRPPPYKGPVKRLLGGLEIGDPRIDALPISAVCCHGGKPRKIGLDPHPAWVDWDSVRRGQQVFLEYIGPSLFSLTIGLLQGFSIARFAEVLFHNGYAQNAETAYERYRETGFAIVDWMSHPLDVEDSKAQIQLQNVRAMHSFARRRSQKLFDRSKGEGIALSQYDMAEVQLSFAGIVMNLLENDLKIVIPREKKRDWCHAWRLVGYHLGIMDEFNACNSLEDMEAIVEEWLPYVPRRFKTCRRATFELQRTAVEGFGRYMGLGVEAISGVLHASCDVRNFGEDLDYLERPCLPGVKLFFNRFFFTRCLENPTFSYYFRMVTNRNVLHMRRTFELYPERAKRLLPVVAAFSKFNDALVWRPLGWFTLKMQDRWNRFLFGYLWGLLLTRSLYRLMHRLAMILSRASRSITAA